MGAVAVAGDSFIALGEGASVTGSVSAARAGSATNRQAAAGIEGEIRGMALDPVDPTIAYAMTATEIFRTSDSGATWNLLPLPWPAAQLRSLAIDPARHEHSSCSTIVAPSTVATATASTG